ncbi:hypothetical protein BVC80_9053g36 [Macleaya cordata]|uniref:Uncharacterized protein n=1 Tax=Macleaya cordata TaxID=56857 RepID=A0A200RA85_MACCD|nr:hypothetical protein BVC80_9053g36 [Macleaya cordata]
MRISDTLVSNFSYIWAANLLLLKSLNLLGFLFSPKGTAELSSLILVILSAITSSALVFLTLIMDVILVAVQAAARSTPTGSNQCRGSIIAQEEYIEIMAKLLSLARYFFLVVLLFFSGGLVMMRVAQGDTCVDEWPCHGDCDNECVQAHGYYAKGGVCLKSFCECSYVC